MPSPESSLAVAVDIGGTFTDVALYNPRSGRVWRAKTPSVPGDPSRAFMTGVVLALEAAGVPASDLGRVLHGTTVATNMILECKGARAALITTAGFRHVLAIGRQDIPPRANLNSWVKPERPVPASRIFEVGERIGPGGAVLNDLDEASVRAAAASCRAAGVEAVAACVLHAFANPAHERRVAGRTQRGRHDRGRAARAHRRGGSPRHPGNRRPSHGGGLRFVSVERGHDPRGFTLVPFGGAGPLHGCALAALLGIRRVLVPPAPGVLCADRLLAADLKAEFSRTLPQAGRIAIAAAETILAELGRQAEDWLAAEGVAVGDRLQAWVALLRYHGQGGELAVP